MSKTGTKWSPEEDRQLLELRAVRTPLAVIAKQLKRTQAAVDSRANKLKREVAECRETPTSARLVELGLKAKGK